MTVVPSEETRQLVLTGAPAPEVPVVAGSTFSVTIGTDAALPDGVAISVELSLSGATVSDAMSQTVMLPAAETERKVEFRVPNEGGAVILQAMGTVDSAPANLSLTIVPAMATVLVQERVSLSLMLDVLDEVTARGEFNVMVSTVPSVPAEATVTVTVSFDGTERGVMLTDAVTSEVVTFTAPASLVDLEVTAEAAVEVADRNALQVEVPPAAAQVRVGALSVQLTLSESDPSPVDAGESFTVEVGVSEELLADTTVTANVTFNEGTMPVVLSDQTPTRTVRFTAPESGILDVTAVLVTADPAGIVVVSNAVPQSVRVREMNTVELTLNAPASVTVGSSFTVTVGVLEGTPILPETTVTVTVSFNATQTTVVLTDMVTTASVSFIAPVSSGRPLLMLSGSAEAQDDLLMVMVMGASARITVVPVQLTLSLAGPESVQVGEAFSVIVGTGDDAVPAGTTVVVTVNDGTTNAEAIMLTAAISTASVSFTAPARAGEVIVMATGIPQTSSGSLEVAVPDASSLAVTAFSVDVQLSLSEVPGDPVSAGSTFTITVGATEDTPIPAGTTVLVTVSFGDTFERVNLTRDASTSTVEVDAPNTGGPQQLNVTGAGVAGGALELNVLSAAAATVQVRDDVDLLLILSASDAVQAGSTFDVNVSTDLPVPAEATVTVTVGFDGAERVAVLTAANVSGVGVLVSFTAPARLVPDGLPVTATDAVEVADSNSLQVMVDASAVARVRVTAHEVELTLSEPDPNPVDAGQSFNVTVGVSPALLVNTTVTAVVTFDESTAQVTLTVTAPTASVSFTVPAEGTLEVTAAAVTVEPAGLVEVADAVAQSVRVRARNTVELTLDASASVTVGSTFTVAVGVSEETPIPMETTVMVTVRFDEAERTAVLTDTVAATSVSFVAPVLSGNFSLVLSGSAAAQDPLLMVMVLGASTRITVVPVQLTLSLAGPGSVPEDENFTVTVGTGDDAVPAGTTVMVTVTDGVTDMPAMLTAAIPTASVSFMAPAGPDQVEVTATGIPQTSSGSLEVAVSNAPAFAVDVFQLSVDVTLELDLSDVVMPVPAGRPFVFTVGASEETPIPPGTTVLVTVSLAGVGVTSNTTLTSTASTSEVSILAPAIGGAADLIAEGMGADGGAVELNVASATVTVLVQEQVTITLSLNAPGSVTVGSTFDVTVSAPLPAAGTTVMVTVELSGVLQETITLSSANPMVTLELTAPNTAAVITLNAAPVADSIEVADPNALMLTVNPSAGDVRVDALRAQLFVTPVVRNVPAASTFAITVRVAVIAPIGGFESELPAETVVTVTVSFGDFESIVSLTSSTSERSVIVDVSADLAGSGDLRLSAEGVATGPLSVAVDPSFLLVSVDEFPVVLSLDVPDTAAAPVFRGVMFPVRASADDLPQGSTLMVTVSLTLEEASIATQSVSLTAGNSSAVVMFEAPVAAAAVTTYTVTTDSEMMGAAVLDVTEAEPAIVYVTRVNADLSGDGAFDEDDVILMARALLTENLAARSEGFDLVGLGSTPDEQRNELQARFDAFAADVADISGNGILDTADAVFLLRNLNATADDLESRVNSGNNPFDYLCGSASQNACMGIESPHTNITGTEGIQYETIGEQLEALRNVPQPPVLPPRTSQSRSKWEI